MTVENLLRWPLEGPTGLAKVDAGLHQVLQMKPLHAQQFIGRGPVRLADGNVLSFAWLQRLSGSVSIGLAQEPCVLPGHAKELISAAQSPVIRDMHGMDIGKTYSTKRNGMLASFTTTPETYRCVTSIQIHSTGKFNP
ncbi:MAG TPA: hypothetical protein VEY92_07970 [Pseudoxanthomonas sp.]|nr:hypothetical protein [Pseudoxanthomonas sp.]